MNITVFKTLIISATLLSGFLAGESIDRLFIGLPAWHYVPIESWAVYSRHADLGIGAFVYPVEAVGSMILLIWASIIILKNKMNATALAVPVFTATLLSITGIFFTVFAAPWMLNLKSSSNDPLVLQNIFNQFYFWSRWRAIVQVLCFPSCAWIMFRAFKF